MTSTLPDARHLAAEVLCRVFDDQAFAAATLRAELDRYPQLDPRDRALATELTYGTLRTARYLEGRLVPLTDRGLSNLDSLTKAHLLLAAYQLALLDRVPAHAAVNSAVEALKRSRSKQIANFSNALLRRFSKEIQTHPIESQNDAVFQGAPRWLRRSLDRTFGEGGAFAFLTAGPVPPPVSLRVLEGDVESWITRLGEELPHSTIRRGKVVGRCLLVQGGGDPRKLSGVISGELSVQEEGSQWVAEQVAPQAGESILDACSGRGNKSFVLANMLKENGKIDAADNDLSKLNQLRDRLRAPPLNATFEVDLSLGLGEIVPSSYDKILIDAPCSGTGTLRRRPEILLRRTQQDIQEMQKLQQQILANASRALKPEGTLFYAVCSVLQEELEDVVQTLSEFRVISIQRLATQESETDGYGVACLKRT
jgi:16S rRNA (cytosine967-C5)-methyltransferase